MQILLLDIDELYYNPMGCHQYPRRETATFMWSYKRIKLHITYYIFGHIIKKKQTNVCLAFACEFCVHIIKFSGEHNIGKQTLVFIENVWCNNSII